MGALTGPPTQCPDGERRRGRRPRCRTTSAARLCRACPRSDVACFSNERARLRRVGLSTSHHRNAACPSWLLPFSESSACLSQSSCKVLLGVEVWIGGKRRGELVMPPQRLRQRLSLRAQPLGEVDTYTLSQLAELTWVWPENALEVPHDFQEAPLRRAVEFAFVALHELMISPVLSRAARSKKLASVARRSTRAFRGRCRSGGELCDQ